MKRPFANHPERIEKEPKKVIVRQGSTSDAADRMAKARAQRKYHTGPRPQRSFSFRGLNFYVSTTNGMSDIYVQNPTTSKMEHQVTVPVEVMTAACGQIAMIVKAWAKLDLLMSGKSHKNLDGNKKAPRPGDREAEYYDDAESED